jgi:hypothetical protein
MAGLRKESIEVVTATQRFLLRESSRCTDAIRFPILLEFRWWATRKKRAGRLVCLYRQRFPTRPREQKVRLGDTNRPTPAEEQNEEDGCWQEGGIPAGDYPVASCHQRKSKRNAARVKKNRDSLGTEPPVPRNKWMVVPWSFLWIIANSRDDQAAVSRSGLLCPIFRLFVSTAAPLDVSDCFCPRE